MDWCKCGHRRDDHVNGVGVCKECQGTTNPCQKFVLGIPPSDVSGKSGNR